MHQYATILIHFAAAQRGIAHLAISVRSWCQFWDFVFFQGTFWPNSPLCPDCTSPSAAAAEIKMRRKWECFCFEVEAANHTEPGRRRAVVRQWTYIMSTRKYDTQNKNCLKSHLLINIRRFSSRIVDFYIKMCKTWPRDPFFFFFRGRTSQWCVLTSCSSNESKIQWVFLLKHNEWKWKEYSIRYYRKHGYCFIVEC